MPWSICVVYFVIGLNFKVCGVVQSLVINQFVLLSLCVMSLLQRCVGCCVLTNHQKVINLALTTFIPIYPKGFDISWTEVLFHCVCVFGVCFPFWWCCVLSLFCLGFNIILSLDGLHLVYLSEGELKHFPIEQMQFVFCFLEVVLMFQPSVAMF